MKKRLTKLLNRFGLYNQSQIRAAVGFAAAKVNRLTNNWTRQTLSPDATLYNDLENLRARSRELKQNNPYMEKFLSMIKTNVLSHAGMMLKNEARDPGRVVGGIAEPGTLDVFANKQIEAAWKEWGKAENCTTSRNMTWQQVNEVCLETAGTDGEVLVQKIEGFGNRFNFALRLFESDHLDVNLNKTLPNGNEIKMGVELNEWGERINYWFRAKNPNEFFQGSQQGSRFIPVPANSIVHPYLIRRIGQTRGYPWAAPTMERVNMLDGYDEAEITRARVSASKHGFLKRTGDASYRGPDDGSGNKYMDVEPGIWDILPEGLEPISFDWDAPTGNFEQFEKRVLRGIASGLLASYNILADDMESVNFSSARVGLMEPREVYKMLQRWWANTFCDPIFSDWLEMQLMTQVIPLPLGKLDKFNAAVWQGRRWQYIEPVKEVDAAIRRMESHLSSLSQELAELGVNDRDSHLDQIVDDMAALEARGLTPTQALVAAGTGNNNSNEE